MGGPYGEARLSPVRVAVIGDIGGHLDALRGELRRLGVDDDRPIPDDLVVVQVGDLVHRGPDSDAVVAYVDRRLRSQPDRWIQLVGNHEANYVRPPVFRWPEQVCRGTARTLQRWWRRRELRVAAAVETDRESFLVTHAGLTAQFWAQSLGAPTTARDAARRLNALGREYGGVLFRTGVMVDGRVEYGVGPVWASCGRELIPSWVARTVPFSQVYGHSTAASWDEGRTGVPIDGAVVSLNGEARHETVWLAGGRLIGIDPGRRRSPAATWRALELDGRIAPDHGA